MVTTDGWHRILRCARNVLAGIENKNRDAVLSWLPRTPLSVRTRPPGNQRIGVGAALCWADPFFSISPKRCGTPGPGV